MELSNLTFQLLLLFFPGIIASKLFEALTRKVKRELHDTLLMSFIYGVASYAICAMLHSVWRSIFWHNSTDPYELFSQLLSVNGRINFRFVQQATGIALLLSIGCVYLHNYKILHKFALRLRATNLRGYSDVWSYLFESPDVQWVIVHDLERKLQYYGFVKSFSQSYTENELLLEDVEVSDENRVLLYSLPALYITRPPDKITIEVLIKENAMGKGNAPPIDSSKQLVDNNRGKTDTPKLKGGDENA